MTMARTTCMIGRLGRPLAMPDDRGTIHKVFPMSGRSAWASLITSTEE